MSNPVIELLQTLSPPQRAAIGIIQLSLNCFNNADGTGLFAGVERYNVLAGRVEICAVQADSMVKFWALLLKRMQWPVPPKRADVLVVQALNVDSPHEVLRVLATETASVITLARMMHDADKSTAREMRAALKAEESAYLRHGNDEPLPLDEFNDPMEF